MPTLSDMRLDLDEQFVRGMFRLIDDQRISLNKCVNFNNPDDPGPVDDIEYLTGLGFVIGQRYLSMGRGWLGIKPPDCFHHGRKLPNDGPYYAEVINAAANYWKHAEEERDLDDPGMLPVIREGTRKVIEALGVDITGPWTNTNVLYKIGITTFSELMPILEEWNKAAVKWKREQP